MISFQALGIPVAPGSLTPNVGVKAAPKASALNDLLGRTLFTLAACRPEHDRNDREDCR